MTGDFAHGRVLGPVQAMNFVDLLICSALSMGLRLGIRAGLQKRDRVVSVKHA